MTDLSGRVDNIESQISFIIQDLLTKTSINTISDFRITWNQELDSFENKLEDTVRDVNILQVLYSNIYNYLTSGYFGSPLSGNYLSETFETINKNLKQYPYNLSYTGETLTGIRYNISPSSFVNKTYTYTSGLLTNISISGMPLPSVSLNKSFTYSGEILTHITYS